MLVGTASVHVNFIQNIHPLYLRGPKALLFKFHFLADEAGELFPGLLNLLRLQ